METKKNQIEGKAVSEAREAQCVKPETWERECHFSRHALSYLMMISYALLNDKAHLAKGIRWQTILNHLAGYVTVTSGRKFSERTIACTLLKRLLAAKPEDGETWLLFMKESWKDLLQFSKRYSSDPACFNAGDEVKFCKLAGAEIQKKFSWLHAEDIGKLWISPFVTGLCFARKEMFAHV